MSVARKQTIFLSSTTEDLAEYRRWVVHVANRLGLAVTSMEDFGPDPAGAVEVCERHVRSAALFVGLYAHRYGFRPEGCGGKSITQLEYEWAVDQGIPVLVYMVDDDYPWPPKHVDRGQASEQLDAFKRRLQATHVTSPLTSADKLRDDLFVHLQAFAQREAEGGAPAPPIRRRLTPPEPYVAHPYTLLETNQMIGRRRELAILQDWATSGRHGDHRAALFCLVAIGGMGKSALTWKWFHDHASTALPAGAGRMWWSFYETGADFGHFVTSALAYLSNRSHEDVEAALGPLERENELLAILDREPHLIVLDGLERLLVAYARLDFAHLADDDLDERTANAVARARQLPPRDAAGSMIGQHRLRKTIDPRVGNFLRRLAGVSASRILVTTRLYPSELQTVTGFELPGCASEFLRGLDPADALELWRGMGVSGRDEQLEALFATFEHYPLLIRALAGKVARHRMAPGDYDRWRADNPTFDPFTLPLTQVRSHVLTHALHELDPHGHALLRTVAGSRQPVDYAALKALFIEGGPRLGADDLDQVLTDLEDRGLLGWNRETNEYDLHPVVRGVVWHGLDPGGRREIYESLASHFEAIPAGTSDEMMSLAEARPAIELFNALVGLGRLPEASRLYFERLFHHNFLGEGAIHEKIAMLESLLPDGPQRPPGGVDDSAIAQLGHSYRSTGRLDDAHTCYVELLSQENAEAPWSWRRGFIASERWLTGRLKEAIAAAESAVQIARGEEEILALCLATAGRTAEAYGAIARLKPSDYFHPDAAMAVPCLWAGDYGRSVEHADRASDSSYRYWDDRWILEARIYLGQGGAHEEALRNQLSLARRNSDVESELTCRRLLAELLRQNRELDEAVAMLDDFWELASRGPYRLELAEAYLVLGRVLRDLGRIAEARDAAAEARRQAECDGPPFTFARAVRDSEALWQELARLA